MPLPPTNRQAILEALSRFNTEMRGTPQWENWEQDSRFRYALEHEGRLYPVKEIIRLATGTEEAFLGGNQANSYVRRHGFSVVSLTNGAGPRAWIFQGNPTHYDLFGALDELDELTWVTRQNRAEIHPGDKIYLWESGQWAGIIAVARVMTEPADEPFLPNELRFQRQPDHFTRTEPRVKLRIAQVLHRRISREELREHPVLRDLTILRAAQSTNFSLSQEQAQALHELVAAGPQERAVKIASGRDAIHWPECLEGGYICVGWDEIGDLSQFSNWGEFHAKFEELFGANYPNASQTRAKARELWTLRQLSPGDIVVANQGTGHVLAVGQVRPDPYQWRPDRREYRHTMLVDWDTSYARDIPAQPTWAFTTVADLTPRQLGIIMSRPVQGEVTVYSIAKSLAGDGLYFTEELVTTYLLALQTKRFAILTGISGTGKTQLAIATARAFQPSVKASKIILPQEGVTEVGVKPYMITRYRMILPASVVSRLDPAVINPQSNGGQITVGYPDGEVRLSFWRAPDSNTVQLNFGRIFGNWFKEHLAVGDHFLIELEESDEVLPSRILISLPKYLETAEPLDNYRVIAVRPDWTDNRGLLGYYNPLTSSYATTPFLDLVIAARDEFKRATDEGRNPYPYFVILDEMNLARVEHYFSDFLSSLESGESIHLHDEVSLESGESENERPIPLSLAIPPNLYITGTVNVDETTYMFSPKVLDRAFTIELNRVDLEGYGQLGAAPPGPAPWDYTLTGQLQPLGRWQKPGAGDWQAFASLDDGKLREMVLQLHRILDHHSRHFGYRVANEIARFVRLATEQNGVGPSLPALDLAIVAKVLPKFHGTQQELEGPLSELLAFAVRGQIADGAAIDLDSWHPYQQLPWAASPYPDWDGTVIVLPRTAYKVRRMLQRLRQHGFTSFIE